MDKVSLIKLPFHSLGIGWVAQDAIALCRGQECLALPQPTPGCGSRGWSTLQETTRTKGEKKWKHGQTTTTGTRLTNAKAQG